MSTFFLPVALLLGLSPLDQVARAPEPPAERAGSSRSVSVKVLIVELTPQKRADGKPFPTQKFEEQGLAGLATDVEGRVMDLRRKGYRISRRWVQFAALENQPASVMTGEDWSYVARVNGKLPDGRVSTIVNGQPIMTGIRATARVADDQTVTLDLDFREQRAHVPEDGEALGNDDEGKPIRATEFFSRSLKTQLRVPPQQAVVAPKPETKPFAALSRLRPLKQEADTAPKPEAKAKFEPPQVILIVTAQVLAADGQAGK